MIKRADITEAGLKYLLVCDQHFITGKFISYNVFNVNITSCFMQKLSEVVKAGKDTPVDDMHSKLKINDQVY